MSDSTTPSTSGNGTADNTEATASAANTSTPTPEAAAAAAGGPVSAETPAVEVPVESVAPEAEAPAPAPTPTEITISAKRLSELENAAAKAVELQDRLLRTQADWDNYRKRAIREKEEAVRYANGSLLEQLFPILDNYEMGMAAATTATDVKTLAFGFEMVKTQLINFLRDNGVETIDDVGKPFNPNLHEAIGQLESSDAAPDTVVKQLRKGYKLKDRLLRPATVMVAKAPEAASTPAAS
ncbi:nucleotide exchange factor GrpE [Verrucomicrobia bacterium LW23]|nr:nucleotide exchange factor GrpE [Verrucomicrobia bacterium LW23]